MRTANCPSRAGNRHQSLLRDPHVRFWRKGFTSRRWMPRAVPSCRKLADGPADVSTQRGETGAKRAMAKTCTGGSQVRCIARRTPSKSCGTRQPPDVDCSADAPLLASLRDGQALEHLSAHRYPASGCGYERHRPADRLSTATTRSLRPTRSRFETCEALSPSPV